MVDHTRKFIRKEVERLSFGYERLESVLEIIQHSIELWGKDARVEEMEEQYSDGKYWAITKDVPETDKEMDVRIKNEEYYGNLREKQDAAEFERLKKKFQNKA